MAKQVRCCPGSGEVGHVPAPDLLRPAGHSVRPGADARNENDGAPTRDELPAAASTLRALDGETHTRCS